MIKTSLFSLLIVASAAHSHAFLYIGSNTEIIDNRIARPQGTVSYVTSSDLVFYGNIADGSGLPVGNNGSASWISGNRAAVPNNNYAEVTYTAAPGYTMNSLGYMVGDFTLTPIDFNNAGTYNISLDLEYQINGSGQWYTHTITSLNTSVYFNEDVMFTFPSLELETPASSLTVRASNLRLNHVGGTDIFDNDWTINNFYLSPGSIRESPVPEPATTSLALLGLAALSSRRRKP